MKKNVTTPATSGTVRREVPCPAPFGVKLNANTPHIVAADFSTAQLANHQEALKYGHTNKGYAHTFEWKPNKKCCQVTHAVLTVKMKSLSTGASATSPDAGNDAISIVGPGGAVILPYSEKVYGPTSIPPTTFPFTVGTPAAKIWTITGAALNKLNTAHTLSIYIQDDTSVLSATLQLSGCCLGLINTSNMTRE
jgi:hypothetical protein